MERTLNADFINGVMNHHAVRPWLGGEGKVDVSEQVANPDNVCLVNEGGGFLCIQIAPGVYEVHSQFLPQFRGESTVNFTKKCGEYMFTRTNCHTILTQVPDDNVAAAVLAKALGFREVFHRQNGLRGPTSYQKLTLDEWVQNSSYLESDGEAFHDQLTLCKKKHGSELEEHPYDPAHERVVGAVVKMIKHGNHFKAVDFYNSWALFAGYAPITIIQDNPVMIDVQDAIVGWDGKQMETLLCR
jgi:hypothetical protein